MNKPAAAVLAELQEYANSMGLVLTARCIRCGAPLTKPESIAVHIGPKCKNKEAVPVPVAKQNTETAK